MIIKKDDIIAYDLNGEIVCEECLTEEENKSVKQNEIILEKDVEFGKHIFCDRCDEKIN
jgi:hypothetical protein